MIKKVNREEALRMALYMCVKRYEDVADRIIFDIEEEGKQYTDESISDVLFHKCADFSRMVEPTIALYFGELEDADIFTQMMGWGNNRLSDWQYAITEAVFGDFFGFNSGKAVEQISKSDNPYTEIKRFLSNKDNMPEVVKAIRKWVLLDDGWMEAVKNMDKVKSKGGRP